MAINVGWDNDEQTVICYQFSGTWTWQDAEAALETSFSLTETVAHKVHVIVDMRHSKGLPDGIILKINKVLQIAPSNRGNIVIVGANSLMKTTLRMAGRIHKAVANRIATAETFEDAYALLRMKPNPARIMDISVLREVAPAEKPNRRFGASFASLTAIFG
ncbi:MAG: hypothetical protein RLP44_29510 [Aggregatilineales bacterium]